MRKYFIIYSFLVVTLGITSCNKSSYLDAKPDQSLIVPSTLKDLQALLDNDQYMNGASFEGIVPILGESSSDNLYIHNSVYLTLETGFQNLYKWDDNIYSSSSKFYDWEYPYRAVFYCNVVLEGLSKLATIDDLNSYNNVKGSALFFRSFMFYNLAQIFGQPYRKANATTDLGIPIRLISDVNEKITRASVEATYNQIIDDLKESIKLLPETPKFKTRPSKPAAYALLARTYLTMADYENASLYADSCLLIRNTLLNYNSITNTSYPFTQFNNEVLFHAELIKIIGGGILLIPSYARVDSTLYKSYDVNDNRKTLFFADALPTFGTSGVYFKGNYTGREDLFGGISTNEVYLIRAESNAKKGNITAAMQDLNTLISSRWKNNGTYIPYSATTIEDAVGKVRKERRKELLFRGLRWPDLRRLNLENENISITRSINGNPISLAPNDLRYTFLIPPGVIGFHPDMPQTPR